MRRLHILLICLLITLTAAYGCTQEEKTPAVDLPPGTVRFEGGSIMTGGGGLEVAGNILTITSAGSYTLSGTLDQGQVRVSADGDVTLIFDNASITCPTGPALDIMAADNVTLTLKEGTQNALEDGASYASGAEQDAALFSKADLVINGTGALTVKANFNDGIASRDTLLIESGTIRVDAKSHGIKGKDYLMIRGGDFTVIAGGDGIKGTNDTQAALGYVEISGGAFSIQAGDDGVSAITRISIFGGELTIKTANNGMKSDDLIEISAATVTIETEDDGLVCQRQDISPDALLLVNGKPQ